MLRHYLAVPFFVILAAAVVGNILGYTAIKDGCVWLYYNSYSLPTFHTVFDPKALILTTVLPLAVMTAIEYLILRKKLKYGPLDFINENIDVMSQRKALKLNHKMPFLSRFSIRVIRQNAGSFVLIVFGIFLADFLAVFGLMFPQIIHGYEQNVGDNLLAKNICILSVPPAVANGYAEAAMEYVDAVQTDTEGAEKFASYELYNEKYRQEEVSIYGIKKHSKFIWELPVQRCSLS